MNEVTNILWLKMSKGLGNINEVNSNSVMMLAKMIIAKEINWKLNNIVKKEQERYNDGEISAEAYTATLAEIKTQGELIKPENINNENMDIDFESIINKQAELEYKEKIFKEKETIIEAEQEKNKKLEKENEEKDLKIKEKNYKINELNMSLDKEKRKNKAFIIIILIFICFYFNIGHKIIKLINNILSLTITQNVISDILADVIVTLIATPLLMRIWSFVKQKVFNKK